MDTEFKEKIEDVINWQNIKDEKVASLTYADSEYQRHSSLLEQMIFKKYKGDTDKTRTWIVGNKAITYRGKYASSSKRFYVNDIEDFDNNDT